MAQARRPARLRGRADPDPGRGLRGARRLLLPAARLHGARDQPALEPGRAGRGGDRERAALLGDPAEPGGRGAAQRGRAHAAPHPRRRAPAAGRGGHARPDLRGPPRGHRAVRGAGRGPGRRHRVGGLEPRVGARARRAAAAPGGPAADRGLGGPERPGGRGSPRAGRGAGRLPGARPQPGAGRPAPALPDAAHAHRGRDAPGRGLRRPARDGARQRLALRGGGEPEDAARAGLRLDLRRLPGARPRSPRGGAQPAGRHPARHQSARGDRAPARPADRDARRVRGLGGGGRARPRGRGGARGRLRRTATSRCGSPSAAPSGG